MHKHLNKKISLSILAWLLAGPMFAADVVAGVPQQQVLEKVMLGFMLATILAALIVMGWLMNVLLSAQKMRLLQEHGVEGLAKAGIKIRSESLWQQWFKKLTKTVPVEQEQEILLDHNYDGIRELDNQMPPWWVATFYMSIAFSVFYIGYQHFSDYGISSQEEYAMEMEQAKVNIAAYLATQTDQVDETNVVPLTDPAEISLGATLFQTSCAVCHGAAGEGGTGPNFADEYWIHGGSIKDIFATIKYGVPEKGMISWKAQLRPSDMQRLSSFILTLQGTNPPNAKEAQGERWVAPVEEESATDEEGPESESEE